ncbi:hypothetical protein GCM10027321_35770 [Massilia terrae]
MVGVVGVGGVAGVAGVAGVVGVAGVAGVARVAGDIVMPDMPEVPDVVPIEPLLPLVPLVPVSIEPLVLLLPLMPLVPLSLPVVAPVLDPLVPIWLLPVEDEALWCFLAFFLWCFLGVVCSVVVLVLWSAAVWPDVLLDCAWTFTEVNIAAATEAPSNAFNSLFIFMSISCELGGNTSTISADTSEGGPSVKRST